MNIVKIVNDKDNKYDSDNKNKINKFNNKKIPLRAARKIHHVSNKELCLPHNLILDNNLLIFLLV